MQVSKASSYAPRRFGKYLLLERIGRGGMAEVYRSKTFGAAGFVKECAIKKILASLLDDEQFVRMFVDEAKLTSYLTHPNIVQVLDLGEIDGHLFIAMEYVAGKDLLDVLARSARRGIRIPVELTLYIATEMLKGLDYAHHALDAKSNAMNIVHRDVSPSNILISYDGQVKVGDFGIAKSQMQSSRTEVGTQKGKTGYMSPEQVTGGRVDHRSDLFAAAVILFEMLTMTRLFKAKNDLEVMLKIRDGDVAADLERAARISPGLSQIIAKGLAKNPDERFQTGGEFLEELRDYIQDRKIKISAHALSAYVSELFADKLEAERARRKDDPDFDEGFDAVSNAYDSVFRYRDPEGVIHGPMRPSMMAELLASRPQNSREGVSYQGGPWRPVAEFSEFSDIERAQSSNLGESGEASGMGLRMTQSGHDWESLAGVNRNVKGRMRSRRSQHEPSLDSGAVPRTRRDPRQRDTRETAIVENSSSAAHRLPDAQSRARRNSPDSTTAPRAVLARTPITKLPASEVRHDVLEGRAADAAADARRRHSTTSENAVARSYQTPIVQPVASDVLRELMRRSASASASTFGALDSAEQPRAGSASGELAGPDSNAETARPPGWGAPSSSSSSAAHFAVPDERHDSISVESDAVEPEPAPDEVEAVRRDVAARSGDATLVGEIGDVTIFRIVHRIARAGANGRLRVSNAAMTKDFYFTDGVLVAADSTDASDGLVEVLRARGQITREQAESALAQVHDGTATVEDALLKAGAIAPHALFHFMQERLSEKLTACLFWEEGSWAWWDDAPFDADPFAAGVAIPDLLGVAVNDVAESRYIRRLYKSRRRTPMIPLRAQDELAPLKLSARAARVASSIHATDTVAEVIRVYCDRYNWPEAEVYRVLFALTEYEVVGFEGAEDVSLPG